MDDEAQAATGDQFDVGRGYGTVSGYYVLLSTSDERQDWALDPEEAERLGRMLLDEAATVRALNRVQEAYKAEWRQVREVEWARLAPELEAEGFDLDPPQAGAVYLSGRLPSGEPFEFACDEHTCWLVTDPGTKASRRWETTVELDGTRHARWMLPYEAVEVLRQLVERRGRQRPPG